MIKKITISTRTGLGDIVEIGARPFARLSDKILGTDFQNCPGCGERKDALNAAVPSVSPSDLFCRKNPNTTMPNFILPVSLTPNPNPPDRPPGRARPTTFALGTMYHFQNVGDELPLHVHPKGQHNHISVILSGTLEYTQGDVVRTVRQSDHEIIDVPAGVEHGFRALEPDSLVLNIRKPSMMGSFAGVRIPAAAHAEEI
jgi:hypothetical protein